jgi:hypothetical protein
MKAAKLFVAGTCLVFFASCQKKTDKKPQPTPVVTLSPQGEGIPPQPSFRLVKIITRDSTQIYRTTILSYDNLNRIISAREEETNRLFFLISYDGDTMKTMSTYDIDGNPFTLEYPLRVSGNGDSLQLTIPRSSDTTIKLLTYRENQLVEKKFSRRISASTSDLQFRMVYAYNDAGNVRLINNVRHDGNPGNAFRPLVFDSRKNFLRDCSRLLLLVPLLGDLEASGVNNYLELDTGNGIREFEYTYNTQGYPVTIRINKNTQWHEYRYEIQ